MITYDIIIQDEASQQATQFLNGLLARLSVLRFEGLQPSDYATINGIRLPLGLVELVFSAVSRKFRGKEFTVYFTEDGDQYRMEATSEGVAYFLHNNN